MDVNGADLRAYQGQVGIERFCILGTDHLVEVVGC
jgi:hypothetical protein